MSLPHILVVGGGAAGFFAAIAAAEGTKGRAKVTLCETTAHPLAKVKVSGGGRCNVTHACFDPRELAKRYPRGSRELLGAFHRFGPKDTIAWFAQRSVELKTESDGRMFPITDDSATIVDALMRAAQQAGVQLRTLCGVAECSRATPDKGSPFRITFTTGETVEVDQLVLATGGIKTSGVMLAEALGHTLEPPVPSLFTFHVDDPRLRELSGLSVPDVVTRVAAADLREQGALLITHWGLSGPAVLKVSAWGARALAACNYRFTLGVNFAPPHSRETAKAALVETRARFPRRQVSGSTPFTLPARLWERLVTAAGIGPTTTYTQTSNDALGLLAEQVVHAEFEVTRKSTNKEEFVTCGGVRLSEVDFRTMESRRQSGLYFAGEVLDVDGITGGFNFQAAWTTGWLAGRSAAAAVVEPQAVVK